MKKKIIALIIILLLGTIVFLVSKFLAENFNQNFPDTSLEEKKEIKEQAEMQIKKAETFSEFKERIFKMVSDNQTSLQSQVYGRFKKSDNDKCLACFELVNEDGDTLSVQIDSQKFNSSTLDSLKENDLLEIELVATLNEEGAIDLIVSEIDNLSKQENNESSSRLTEQEPAQNIDYNNAYFMYLDIDESAREFRIDSDFNF